MRLVDRRRDLAGLERLFAVSARADGHPPLGEHKYLDLVSGGGEFSVGVVEEGGAGFSGYVHLTHNPRAGVWGLELAVDPAVRGSDLAERLIRRGLEEAGRIAGGEVHFWTFHPWLAGVAADMGFTESRELRKLRIGLPPADRPRLPAGVELRAFRPGQDETAWLELNNRAFAGHPENGHWDAGTLADRERRPWFDPAGFILAWEGEELAGFCWTKLHSPEVGEIYVIAIDPVRQSRGLGRALVLSGLWHLHQQRGAGIGILYVDAGNSRAIELYRSLGFRLDHIDRCFVAEVSAAA